MEMGLKPNEISSASHEKLKGMSLEGYRWRAGEIETDREEL